MKFNWGTGIALVYAVFAFGMLGAVFAARRHDPGLVAKNYYDLDLHYQQRIVEKQNAAALSEPLKISHLREHGELTLHFPRAAGLPTGGTVKMYKGPAGPGGDFGAPVKTDETGHMQIPVGHFAPGRWHVEVVWNAAGRSFFHETAVQIDK